MSYDPQSMNVFDDRQKQALDSRYGPNWAPVGAAEPWPRWACTTHAAPSAGAIHFSRILLQAKPYTTVTLVKGGTAGTGLTTAYLGLYDCASLRLRAQSADISVALQAQAAPSNATYALSYTVPVAGDYWLALLVGAGTTTVPTFVRYASPYDQLISLPPPLSGQTGGGLTTLTDPLVPLGGFFGNSTWFRYQ